MRNGLKPSFQPASVALDEVVTEALLRALSGLLFLSTAFAALFAAISLDAAWPLCSKKYDVNINVTLCR